MYKLIDSTGKRQRNVGKKVKINVNDQNELRVKFKYTQYRKFFSLFSIATGFSESFQ